MRHFALLALVLGFAACRDNSSSGDDTVQPDAGSDPNDVTIQEIQNDAMPACNTADPSTCVEIKLKGVVVTAIDNFGMTKGDFWVQEPGGGPYSGVQVFGAAVDQVAAIQIGDVVDISGAEKKEFFNLTELKPIEGGTMTVTRTGATMQIEPEVVDALKIGQLSDPMASAAEWEKWEGVLIKVTTVQSFSGTDCIKKMGTCSDPTWEKFKITGSAEVPSSLAAMPDPKIAFGDCLTGVTGVVGFAASSYQILPRTTAEIGTGGTSCPKENTMATCADGIDNDGNGYKDCADLACGAASAACQTETTIEAIQTAATPPTGTVQLKNVCVVAQSAPTGMPTATSKNLWVQTSDTQASANNGIYVFTPGTDLGAFTPGKKVNVVGTVKEFNDKNNTGTGTLTEISATSVTDAGGTCTPTPMLDQSAATLSMDASGEPAESVLVELKNVTITTTADTKYFVGQMKQGTQSFKFDDDIFRLTTAAGATCYNFTGIWSYQVYDNAWYFLPTQAGASTTCP